MKELDVHGPDGKLIPVTPGEELDAALKEELRKKRGQERKSQLTAYFNYNAEMAAKGTPLHLTYDRAYKCIHFDNRDQKWKEYKMQGKMDKVITRIKTVSPANLELLVNYEI